MDVILLAGPKHAGKTSAGRALANRISGAFVDLDEFITAQTGKSPRTLYREGSGIFRKAEAEALGALLAGESRAAGPRIIAAGGGLIDNPEALARLEKAGPALTVYLEVSVETAWGRISRAAEKSGLPPFLDTPDPQAAHRVLHEKRAAAYREWAAFTVNGDGKSPEEIAGEICGILRRPDPCLA
jgi:shikimate kinase